jgi:hypothetical protein
MEYHRCSVIRSWIPQKDSGKGNTRKKGQWHAKGKEEAVSA